MSRTVTRQHATPFRDPLTYALLRAKIKPTSADVEGCSDIFISHDWGRPVDGHSLSNSERAAKIKSWLETTGRWKVESGAEVESGASTSCWSRAPVATAKGGDAKKGNAKGDAKGNAKGDGPHNEPGHWDFMVSYTQRSDKAWPYRTLVVVEEWWCWWCSSRRRYRA